MGSDPPVRVPEAMGVLGGTVHDWLNSGSGALQWVLIFALLRHCGVL